MHDLPLLSTLAGSLAAALVFGWVTQRLGLSTLVGYMLAGVLVGPYTPGFVADANLATQMAEIGVILLMFGVGMHFHPQELLRVWRIAVPGAIAQSAVATLAGWACARWFGWSNAAGFVFGMALAVASTVVLIRMLVDQDRLSTRAGHVAVGWLIVEDLFTVLALVVLPVLAVDEAGLAQFGMPLLVALGKAAVFALLVWFVGSRVVSQVLERMAKKRSEELFTLTVFVVALGIAVLAAQVFHVSVALGELGAAIVYGNASRPDVLRAAHLDHARAVVVTDAVLTEKMRICIAARALNPRIPIIAVAASGAERAWLAEFGATFICDTLADATDSLVRSIRRTL